MKNEMDTVLKRALHYVECYSLQFPHSGAQDVVIELQNEITKVNNTSLLDTLNISKDAIWGDNKKPEFNQAEGNTDEE